MNNIALFNFIPKYCPNCGTPFNYTKTGWDVYDYNHFASQSCNHCGTHFQRVEDAPLLTAATSSGGDLAQYVTGETQ